MHNGEGLTRKEIEVLKGVAQGKAQGDKDEAIARKLGIPYSALVTYLRNIRRKLDAQTTIQAISIARRKGILIDIETCPPEAIEELYPGSEIAKRIADTLGGNTRVYGNCIALTEWLPLTKYTKDGYIPCTLEEKGLFLHDITIDYWTNLNFSEPFLSIRRDFKPRPKDGSNKAKCAMIALEIPLSDFRFKASPKLILHLIPTDYYMYYAVNRKVEIKPEFKSVGWTYTQPQDPLLRQRCEEMCKGFWDIDQIENKVVSVPPNQFVAHIVVICMQDATVIFTKRSHQVEHYKEMWSCSLEEQMVRPKKPSEDDQVEAVESPDFEGAVPSLQKLVLRALWEELGVGKPENYRVPRPAPRRIKLTGVILEPLNFNTGVIILVELDCKSDELIKGAVSFADPDSKREMDDFIAVPLMEGGSLTFRLDERSPVAKGRSFPLVDVLYNLADPGNALSRLRALHPTSPIRIIHTLLYELGETGLEALERVHQKRA